jgi:O-antigen/teichoic acid export membrane protein
MIPFDAGGAFSVADNDGKLRQLAVRGAGATISASGVNLAVQVISTVALSRLLTPADFGLVTLITTFSLLLVSVGSNGFTEAVIQCKGIDCQTASNLFWLNTGVGLVLALAFAGAGSLLAHLFRNPLAANAAAVTSIAVFIPAASVIHLALLKRAMRFTAASANEVAARAAYSLVAVVMALMGAGYWALIAGLIAAALSTTIGAWWFCRWIPSLPRRTGRTMPFVRFAVTVYGRFGIRYATQNVDNLLVGWRFDAVALGLYKKAYDLFALSATQLTAPLHNVALAALSRLSEDQPRLRRNLVESLEIIGFLGMGVSACLTLVGKYLVRLAMGPQWEESGRIFELLGPGIGAMLLSSTVGWIHLSLGTPGRWLRWTVIELGVTVSLFIVALQLGPVGIAAAWSVSYWILLLPAFWYAGRPIGFGISLLSAAVWKSVLASLVGGMATAAAMRHTPFWGRPLDTADAFWKTIVISAVLTTFYLGTVILLYRGWGPLYRLAVLLRELAPTRRSKRPVPEAVV